MTERTVDLLLIAFAVAVALGNLAIGSYGIAALGFGVSAWMLSDVEPLRSER